MSSQYNLIDNREIRIFISSTFQDMQEERDFLMTKTFPVLKSLASERNVTLTELDLRWGISEEESENGRVVEICLKEIENCIPFFIGIVGSRYGWCPSFEDVRNTIESNVKYKWIHNDVVAGLSVTEMEMQYGVLRREEPVNAFFYIKCGEEISDIDNADKLNHLKLEIRNNGRYPVNDYQSVEHLAKQVERDFCDLLDKLFPVGDVTPLEKELISKKSYIRTLCRGYVPDYKGFDALNAFLRNADEQYFVVTGQSGMGKSSLLANWTKTIERDVDCICHFVGNGGSNSDHHHILQMLRDEILYMYDVDQHQIDKIKSISDEEKQILEIWGLVATKKKNLLILIDAINQIVNQDDAKLMNWLPKPPSNVKIIFSTLEEDETMKIFQTRKYPIFKLQPLDRDRRIQLINSYLSEFGKKLNAEQIDKIVNDDQNENTMVLKTLLDELIRFGNYQMLNNRIDYYLSAVTIEDFYMLLLQQYEVDFGKAFVSDILSLIAVANKGMQEDEIQNILKIRQLEWSQFYCAFSSHLLNKNGLISFSHSYIRNSVSQRYLSDVKDERKYQKMISDFFEDVFTERSLQERAYMYYKLEEFQKLSDLLLHYDVLDYYYTDFEYDLGFYCRFLVNKPDVEFDLSYMLYPDVSMKDEDLLYYYNILSQICQNLLSWVDLGCEFSKKGVDLYDKHPEWERDFRYLSSYSNLANSFKNIGDIENARICFEKLINSIDPNNDTTKGYLSTAYSDLGDLYLLSGDYEKDIEMQYKAMDVYNSMGEEHEIHIAAIIKGIGIAESQNGDFERAEKHFLEALDMYVLLVGSDSLDVATTKVQLSLHYVNSGNYNAASKCLENVESTIVHYLGEAHLITAMMYYLKSYCFSMFKQKGDAVKYGELAVKAYKSLGGEDYFELVKAYTQLGNSYLGISNYSQAELCFQEGIRVSKNGFERHPNTALLYNSYGIMFNELRDYKKAIEMYKHSLEILDDILEGSHFFKVNIINNIGLAYSNLGDLDNAITYSDQAYDMAVEIFGEENPNIFMLINNKALYLLYQKKYEESLALLENLYALRRRVVGDDNEDDVTVLSNIGMNQNYLNRLDDALTTFLKAYEILQKPECEDNLMKIIVYNNLAGVCLDMDKYDDTLRYLNLETQFLNTHSEEHWNDWLNHFRMYSMCYKKQNRYEEALKYYELEYEWLKKYGMDNEDDIKDCLENIEKAKSALAESN